MSSNGHTERPDHDAHPHAQDLGEGHRHTVDTDHDRDHDDGHGAAGGPGAGHRDHDHPGGLRGLLRSFLVPHSHDAAESVDQVLTSSREGIRALKISFGALLVTAALQVAVVVISGSVALLGDTIHNFADALTALPLGLAFWLGRRRPTRRYTYGYGRSEDLAGIFIVVMIALSSAVAGYEAVRRLLHPTEVRNVGWVMAAGLIGFAGNELVALYRIRVGRKIGSAALVADGLHARTDGLTSLAVFAGAVGVALGFQLADPLVGLAITVAILFVLKGAARDIYRRLMDSVDPDLVDHVERVLSGAPGVEQVETVRLRWVGHQLRAEAEIVSDSDLTLAQAHAIAEEAHHQLLHQIPRLAQALIHTSPCNHGGRNHHETTSHHFKPHP